jgi:hypothetical protein
MGNINELLELERLRREYYGLPGIGEKPPEQSQIGYDDSQARFEYDARKRQERVDAAIRMALDRQKQEQFTYDTRRQKWGEYPGGRVLGDILLSPPAPVTGKTIQELLPLTAPR